MFGYITTNTPELKIKDYLEYHSYYCGLCRSLGRNHGQGSRLTLSYDMAFTAMLLTALYEPKEQLYHKRCPLHPGRKLLMRENLYTEYAADMNLILTYYKLMDDWDDEGKLKARAGAFALIPEMRKLQKQYPDKCRLIKDRIRKIRETERRGEENPDVPAGLFGEIMAEIMTPHKDEWRRDLSALGFYLGKYIYLLDAYDDLEDDIRNNNYNVLIRYSDNADFDDMVRKMLTMMMSECARAFERLPIVKDAEILRNIIYAGVWTKFSERLSKRNVQ